MTTPRGGGRRVATRERPRADRSTLIAVLLVLAAALAVLATRSPDAEGPSADLAGAVVDRTVLVCPETAKDARGPVDAGLAPVRGLGDQGSVEAGEPGGSDAAPLDVARGELAEVDGEAPVLDARGEVAAGLFASRTARDGSALGVGACVAPRARWWFTGAGAGLDHATELWLTNVDPGPAVVDVRVLGQDGEVETVGTRGITVAPGESRRLVLADVAPQNDEAVVAVEASRGRVAVLAADRFAPRPSAPSGLEWLTATDEPARVVRLAGVPADAAGRELVLGNPSDLEALVELELSGSRGSFVPTGAETISVPPGGVRVVDASEFMPDGEPTAVRLSSQVPVVATVRSVGRADDSYASTVRPLTDPAAAPQVEGARGTVQLTAGAGGGVARVSAHDRDGEVLDETRLRVDPAATATWRPPPRAAYLLVSPVEGNLHGAVTYAGPAGVSTYPLVTLPIRLAVPAVVPGTR